MLVTSQQFPAFPVLGRDLFEDILFIVTRASLPGRVVSAPGTTSKLPDPIITESLPQVKFGRWTAGVSLVQLGFA